MGLVTGGLNSNGDPVSGNNTGDVTLAAVGSSPNANGGTLTAQAYNPEPASASFPGVIVAGTQSFPPGEKTIDGQLTAYGASIAPLATPTHGTFTTAATGGTLTGNTLYYYRVAATNGSGTSLAATETSKLTATGTNTNTITVVWTQVTGATGYKVYGRTTGGELLIGTITSGATLSFVDDNSVTPAGALPSLNTSGALAITTAVNSDSAPGLTMADGVRFKWGTFIFYTSGTTLLSDYTSRFGRYIGTNSSGSESFTVLTSGSRIKHGAGTSDYSSSDGTTVTFAGPLATAGLLTGTGGFATDYTDSSGTPGAATINKPSGISAFAAGASSVAITNSLVTTSTRAFAVLQTNDTTALYIRSCICTANTLTIHTTANATGTTKVAWWILS